MEPKKENDLEDEEFDDKEELEDDEKQPKIKNE